MTPGIVPVVMINGAGTGVTHDQLVACAAALTIQACQHFALPPPHGYGMGATVRVGAGAFDVKPGEWVLALIAKPDIQGALGYHDQTIHGQPLMKVFPLLEGPGERWETTASHELLETLADPDIDRAAQASDGKFWAYEACDAVEAYSYMVNGIPMSDFILPPYFGNVKNMHGLKYDWMGLVKAPLQILQGGYGQYFDPAKGWTQVLAQHADGSHVFPRAYRQTIHGRSAGRSARRSGRT